MPIFQKGAILKGFVSISATLSLLFICAKLMKCNAFAGNEHCQQCNHHWENHLHVNHELEEQMKTVEDEAIVEQLAKNANDIELKQTAIAECEKKIEEADYEYREIQTAAVRFGVFLLKLRLLFIEAPPQLRDLVERFAELIKANVQVALLLLQVVTLLVEQFHELRNKVEKLSWGQICGLLLLTLESLVEMLQRVVHMNHSVDNCVSVR